MMWQSDEIGRDDDFREEIEMFMRTNPVAKGNYENGEKNGHWTFWYPNGQKWQEGMYRKGRRQGMWTIWSESGLKTGQGSYKNGKRHGTWTFWLEDGKVQAECMYRSGALAGPYRDTTRVA